MNTLTASEIVTLKAALSVAADALLEQAGWCGDSASEENLRDEAQEYHDLYKKLDQ